MNLAHGGHLTHGSPANLSGAYFNAVSYGVNDDGVIDYEEVRRIAKECKPKLIVAGASAYARVIDFKSSVRSRMRQVLISWWIWLILRAWSQEGSIKPDSLCGRSHYHNA